MSTPRAFRDDYDPPEPEAPSPSDVVFEVYGDPRYGTAPDGAA